MLADDHVARLEIAMQDSSAVGVVDRVADVDEPPEQFAERQRPPAGIRLQTLVTVECSMASLSESPRMNRMA